jgi:Tfp pilus assembly protein PilF
MRPPGPVPDTGQQLNRQRKNLKALMHGIVFRSVIALSLLALAGCSQLDASGTDGDMVPKEPPLTAEAAEVPSQSPLRRAYDAYHRSDFGLSERYFREAVEHNAGDAKAWIGLAASYDQLRRFELADRAYDKARKLTGETAQLLNNQGYSRLLRGDLRGARAKFAQAAQLQPDDPTVTNNMRLVEDRQVNLPH